VCPQPLDRPGTFRRIPTDRYVLEALAAGRIRVDPNTGAITGTHGNRLERVARDASGRVRVRRRPRSVWAPAHRVVWLAVHGEIPDRHVVRHHNGRKWDNRPVNLYLSRQRGFITYPGRASS
jgi:hypothetical protein